MADIVLQRDVGSLGPLVRLSAEATATAGGSGDSATTTGGTIDRFGFGAASPPNSLEAAVLFDATLSSGKSLVIGYDVQEGPDGSAWSDYQTATYATVATGASGGSVAAGQLQVGVDLTSARRYVRFNSNQHLTATGTDTSVTRSAGFFAGFDRLGQGPG